MIKKMCLFVVMVILICSVAFAMDLSDYPDLFLKGNRLNLYIVIGRAAAAEDVIGAVDVAASLMSASQQHSYESVARLDDEILDDIGNKNMILVGGPCANAATAKVMDYPVDCNEGFEVGKSRLILYENNGNFSLVVAGRTAPDTRRATNVLSDYSNPTYNFNGTELIIEGIGSTQTGIDVK
jgi:hypothetical protein